MVIIATTVFLKASIDEWEDGATQLAVRWIEMRSRTIYASALRRFLEGSDVKKGLVIALNDRLHQLARRPRGYLAAKGLLLVAHMPEKFQLITPTDLTRRWMQVEGIKRITISTIAPLVFAETTDLELLGKHREHWGWVKLFFLSTCTVVFIMRSTDSESVTWKVDLPSRGTPRGAWELQRMCIWVGQSLISRRRRGRGGMAQRAAGRPLCQTPAPMGIHKHHIPTLPKALDRFPL